MEALLLLTLEKTQAVYPCSFIATECLKLLQHKSEKSCKVSCGARAGWIHGSEDLFYSKCYIRLGEMDPFSYFVKEDW